MTGALLEARTLSKSYGGVHAVRNVSFRMTKAEILALIGPNGAGKSTCFGMLGGQIRPDRGQVYFQEADITGLKPRVLFRKGIGRTFQIAATFGSMTVGENIELALCSHSGQARRLLGGFPAANRDKADRLLRAVGLADLIGTAAGSLSYGDVKRLELALALCNDPQLLLMDEPTAGMGAAERMDLMRLVGRLAGDSGIGILFTEHDMDAVFTYATRVLVLDRGELIADGSAQEVRADARVRRLYLGDGLTSGRAS